MKGHILPSATLTKRYACTSYRFFIGPPQKKVAYKIAPLSEENVTELDQVLGIALAVE